MEQLQPKNLVIWVVTKILSIHFFWLLHYNMGVDQLQQKTLVAQVAIEIWLIFLFYSVVVTLTRVWTGCD